MTFIKGNKDAAKLSTLELKLEAFKQYLNHISRGKTKRSWFFRHPELTLTWETMEKYIANEPSVFDSKQIEAAYCEGYQIWEQVVEDSAKGANKDANTASLQMLMRNKFKWDKQEEQKSSSTENLVNAIAERWKQKGETYAMETTPESSTS